MHGFDCNVCIPLGAKRVGDEARVHLGATYEHWSRFIAMSFLCEVALILIVTKVVDYVLGLVAAQLAYLRAHNTATI